jgi:hypothetical protein
MNKEEDGFFFFIDGHVRVYHGSLASLPKRFVSREKLCLPGTTEFWVQRWSQENFFRYMVLDYDFDKMIQYGIEEVNSEAVVVNPYYRNLACRIKKKRKQLFRVLTFAWPTKQCNHNLREIRSSEI